MTSRTALPGTRMATPGGKSTIESPTAFCEPATSEVTRNEAVGPSEQSVGRAGSKATPRSSTVGSSW
ncbi:MAG: hypothetical protein WKG00_00100 [Polyangiaceae bacterium]